jgi:hypothetical protein
VIFFSRFFRSFFSNIAIMDVKAYITAQAPRVCKDETTSNLSTARWEIAGQTMLDYDGNPVDNLHQLAKRSS